MLDKRITPMAVEELAQLAGIRFSPEKLERLAARVAAFYRDMAKLEQVKVGQLNPDFVQPLPGERR